MTVRLIDYSGPYAALARRVSAALVFMQCRRPVDAEMELDEAMKVIEAMERWCLTPSLVVDTNQEDQG